jgi:hypothetical protein
VQQELEEANDHMDMHHLEMEANEARSEGEEAPEELGPAPGANGTTVGDLFSSAKSLRTRQHRKC